MKRKVNLQQKILFIVIGLSSLIYIISIGYISISSQRAAMKDAVEVTIATADKFASEMKALLEKDLAAAKTLAQSVTSYKLMPEEQWKKVFASMYAEVLKQNPNYLSVWDSWELSHIDTNYTKSYGRYKAEFWREGNEVKGRFYLSSLTGDGASYARIKSNPTDKLENPYFANYTNNEKDNQLMTSFVIPLVENKKFIGVIGLDIALENYYNIVRQINPFKGSHSFLLSNDLKYVAHSDKEKLGLNAMDDYEEIFNVHNAPEKIVAGEHLSFQAKDIDGTESMFVLSPIIIGQTGSPWSLVVVVPKSIILSQANRNFVISLIVGLLGLLILSSVVFFFSRSLTEPISAITSTLKRMAQGNIADDMKLKITSADEVGEMTQALNTTIEGLSHKVSFAASIGKGDLNTHIDVLSDQDALGQALIDMRNSLKKAEEENAIRQAEDEKRRWANEGLAKFAEILRQENSNMELLAKSIIRELVQTLNANQGGLFLFNEDDDDNPHFELVATYAYNRFKLKQKKVLLGEGLIGACAIERKTILLTEIPEGYIEITSGLGHSTPSSLIIVPLLMEDKVLGVFEIASFSAFEPYQVEFLEKLGQSIASTITSVRVNIRTTLLLAKTQQQAEEMAAQEEEMRQNMEELQATQEESTRKTAEMQSFIDALNNSSFVIEYDTLGYITAINDPYLELLGLTRDAVIGSHHSDKLDMTPDKKKEYDNFWVNLRNGIPQRQVNKFVVHGKSFVFQETYTPIKNDLGEVYKILKISNNITNLLS